MSSILFNKKQLIHYIHDYIFENKNRNSPYLSDSSIKLSLEHPFEGIWRMDKEHEVKFEKTRRICMNLAKSVGGAGRLFVIGCKPKWMLEQQDEVYIDCMEQRGYKYLGLESDKAK